MKEDVQIYSEVKNSLGIITLNRPGVLNALNLEMVTYIHEKLAKWAHCDDIKAVLIKGNGEKALCAGGDIKSLYMEGHTTQESTELSRQFFKNEYGINELISNFPKPFIALMNGIVMGGGLGVSAHGNIRIINENSILAMPEVLIGYFTDIGASYFLNQFPGHLGKYVALLAYRMDAADALYTGIATHFVPLKDFNSLYDAIVESPDELSSILKSHCQEPQTESKLKQNRDLIDQYFVSDDLSQIYKTLEENRNINPWFAQTLEQMGKGSLLSQSIVLEQLKRGKELKNMHDIMHMEFILSQNFMMCPDFYEGIRAMLVDKTHDPHFLYKSTSEISAELVQSFFTPQLDAQAFKLKFKK